jgi:hypothetical protein
MEKPTSIRLNEFKTNAVNLVNESGLPYFVIEPVLRDLLSVIQTKAEQQYQRDKAVYEESLKAQENKEDESHD